jgi:hypothetical protein
MLAQSLNSSSSTHILTRHNMNTVAVYGGFAIVLATSALGTASSAPSWTLANLSNVQVRCECAADSIFVTLWF